MERSARLCQLSPMTETIKSAGYMPKLWEQPATPALPAPDSDVVLLAAMRAARAADPRLSSPSSFVAVLGRRFPDREGPDLYWHVRRLWAEVIRDG